MSYIGQAPGLGQRSVFRFVATAGQTVFSGRDANGLVLGYTPGVPTIIAYNGRLLSGPDVTATDGSTVTTASALNAGDELLILADAAWNPANTYTVDAADVKFTRKRNRILDPGMRVSQENGTNAMVLANATPVLPTDSWIAYRVGTAGGVTVQRVSVQTPGGSPNRLRATVTTANASPGASDSFQLLSRIEGYDVADLQFGTAAAKTITLRLGLRVSLPGTYSVAFGNTSLTRTYPTSVTILPSEAGVDLVKTITIPGDQSGAWAKDNSIGLQVLVSPQMGSGYVGATGWGATNSLGVIGCTNLLATAGATFDLFDVGLYEGTVVPPFELSSYAEDLFKCMRYYEKCGNGIFFRSNSTTSVESGGCLFRTPKRVNPSISLIPGFINAVLFGIGNRSAGVTTFGSYGTVDTLGSGPLLINGWQADMSLGTGFGAMANDFFVANARL